MKTQNPSGPRWRKAGVILALVLCASLGVAAVTQALANGMPSTRYVTELRGGPADEGPESQSAPTRPADPVEPHPLGGYVPPDVDLSQYQARAGSLSPAAVLSRFDWRELGAVTRVQDQNPCGACYAFASLAGFESRVLIDGGETWDFSENNAKECGYNARSCAGGNYYEMANLFSQTGTVLESCDPYVPSDVSCTTGCPYQKTLLGWGAISGASIPDTDVLKSYIADHGPVMTTLYVGASYNSWGREFNAYDGGYTLCYTGTGTPNHGVLIVGWDDALVHKGGTGGWIVKNSWGTSWGGTCGYGAEGGYFTIAYGSAKIGYDSAYISEWQDYDANGGILYYDEAGWGGLSRGYNSTVAWGLARYYPPGNTFATRVEFWTTDATTDVDVYLYGDFDGTTLSNPLAQKLDCSFSEPGYHSVALNTPLPISAGDDVIAVVRFTNKSFKYPIAVDSTGPSEAGHSYMSSTGASWKDLGSAYADDIGIRIRTSSETAGTPTPTTTGSRTASVTPTRTRTGTPTATRTRTPTRTPTRTVTPTVTPTRSATPTSTHTPSRTATSTASQTPRPTNTPGPSPTWVPGAHAQLWLPVVPREHGLPAVPMATPTASRTRTQTSTATPTRTRTPTPTETPTSAQGVYFVGDTTQYVDNIDYLHIVGEVMNDTDDTLRFVRVTADLLDAQGAFLGSGYTYTRLGNLAPHSSTCFHVMAPEPEGVASVQLQPPTYWTDGTPPPQLTVVSQNGSYDTRYGWYRVNGEIRNEEASAVRYVRPVVSLYDGLGHIVGCDSTFVDGTHLDAQQTGTFSMSISGRDFQDVAGIRVQVDGDKQ